MFEISVIIFCLIINAVLASSEVAVGTPITRRPPHRSVRAELPHTAPTSGIWRKSVPLDMGVVSGL